MTISLLNYLTSNLSNQYKIQIVLDQQSLISKTLFNKISNTELVTIINPSSLINLLEIIENIDFGIFMDSGPLHVAKILNKQGVVIISSVNEKNLVSNFDNIKYMKNEYISRYCQGPCGLTNIFNYNNMSGCYDSLQISKNKIINNENLKEFQRGKIKNDYIKFILNPVNCLKKINNNKVLELIKNSIN